MTVTRSLLLALLIPSAASAQMTAPFDGFPGLPCVMVEGMTPPGFSPGDRHPISLWLHGFLSGANWANPQINLQEDGAIVASFHEIERAVTEACTDDPTGTITADLLNSLYKT